MTIDGCVAEWTRMADSGYFYDNSGNRCLPIPYKGRDCSTFAAEGIDAGFPGAVDRCSNSFGQAEWCFNQPRPDWFTARFGSGPGTFITEEQAQHVVCLGFRGSDWGMRADDTGDGHTECILGQGTRTVGAHSHASGVGFDNNGINNHQLSYFAIPPAFLTELAGPPIDAATLIAIRKLADWKDRVSRRPLRYKMTNGDVTILNSLLLLRGLEGKKSNTYGRLTRRGVAHLKRANGWTPDGSVFGSRAATALLAPPKA